jgi:hypothetical protein
MKRSSRPRGIAKLSESMNRRLDSYVLAASAVGVGILALTPPSEAKIIYTPTHHVIKEGGSYQLDVNRDGITDFTFLAKYSQTTSGFFAYLSAAPAAGNGVEGWTGFQAWDFALKQGDRIGSRHYFPGKMLVVAASLAGSNYDGGSWVNVKNRYLGLKFKISGKTHYGWARLSVQVEGSSIVGTLTGYAYETVPGKPVKAGQTKGASNGSLQPASLGGLAKGAAAISDSTH